MNRNMLAAVAVALTSTVALAGNTGHAIQTGEGLVKMCNGAEKVKMLGMMCHSYLNGYLDTALVYDQTPRFCLGAGDKQRLPTVVITWLNAHPGYLQRPAPEALAHVLADNYPCRK